MVDTTLGCRRTDESGKNVCKGVAHLEGEGRERKLKYRCVKCGFPFTIVRGRAAGLDTFNLGIPGDKLRDSFK